MIMEPNQISREIIGAATEAHRALGPGVKICVL